MKDVHFSGSSGVSRDLQFKIYPIIRLLFWLSLSFTLINKAPAEGASLPTGFAETKIVGSLWSPTAMAFAPDGRIFFCEQTGALRVVKNGTLLSAPFVTLTVNSSGERGLLGIAFDPNFNSNHYVYVYYTATSPAIHNRVSRFTANGDVASGGETVLLDLNNLSSATNHNGGAMHFGSDGKLYIAVGENANGTNSQTLGNLLGKILRINPNGSIPTDNPFYNSASGNNRAIWALGLRNPFTFNMQPGTSRMFIDDVGQSTWEEINDGIAGSNYGWPNTEGPTGNPSYRAPLFSYGHGGQSTTGCAITGGTFYNPQTTQFPASYVGDYFFADYCTGWIRKLDTANYSASNFASGISNPVDLEVSSSGSLYYLARGGGSNTGALYRIDYTASQAPSISSQPSNTTVSVGQPASFSVTASGTAPLSYQWQRNSSNISGATSSTYTISSTTMSDNGAQFRCVVTNSYGSATSNQATLTVVSNAAPTATITQPPSGTKYDAGDLINYSGTGTDPEDGTLPASAFTWRVDLHHDTHIHPFIPDTTGSKSGSFTVPTTGHTSSNVWYRIHLTVVDSGGLSTSVYRDITPNVVNLTFTTNPPGLQLKLDAQPITAPYSENGVVGILRNIEAVSPQTVGSTTYQFVSWSDAGARIHDISTPSSNTTYTATFQVGSGGGSWLNQDIGNVGNPGSTTISGGTYTIKGSGSDIWGSSDSFQYAYQSLNGDGEIIARVASLQNTDPYAKAAVMIRETLAANAKHASMMITSGHGLFFQRRTATGGSSASTVGGSGTAPYWIRLVRTGNTFTGYKSTNGTSWTLVGSVSITMNASVYLGLAVTSHKVGTLCTAVFDNVTVPGGGGLPSGWLDTDIGNPGVHGALNYSGGTFTVDGGGQDIWGTSDSFHFAYKTLSGDGQIVAKVNSVENTNGWAKAGVMIRDTLANNAEHASMLITPSNGIAFQRRTATGGSSATTSGGSATMPYWLKVVRTGSTFTGYKSTDGISWSQVGTTTINMGTTVYIGLAVTSHNNGTLCTSTFSNVSP